MLEKGLSMRPRRTTFAVDYIEETLDKLASCKRQGVLGQEMSAWARDVLAEYFVATAESTSKAIVRARARFEQIDLTSEICHNVGPHPAGRAESHLDFASLKGLVLSRESVRWFSAQSVPRTSIDSALDLAVEAPTACNRVPYRFLVFDDARDAQRVAAIAGGTTGYVENIPALAVLVGDLSAYVDERDRHLIYIDGSLAAMNFLLGLQAQGLASCCINWPDVRRREKQMSKLLGLLPYERVVMLIAFGFADPLGLVPGSPKVSRDQYRQYPGLPVKEEARGHSE
jgi:nitroreductase